VELSQLNHKLKWKSFLRLVQRRSTTTICCVMWRENPDQYRWMSKVLGIFFIMLCSCKDKRQLSSTLVHLNHWSLGASMLTKNAQELLRLRILDNSISILQLRNRKRIYRSCKLSQNMALWNKESDRKLKLFLLPWVRYVLVNKHSCWASQVAQITSSCWKGKPRNLVWSCLSYVMIMAASLF